MTMYVLFGVALGSFPSVDEVAIRVAALVGVEPVNRTGEEKGDYCTFDGLNGEVIQLVSGVWRDEDGEYAPEPEFSEWPYLLYLNNTQQNSSWLNALESAGLPFAKLRTDVADVRSRQRGE